MANPADEVLFEVTDGVGHITLNRPRAINALTEQMFAAMADALAAWVDDPAVESVELRGAGERGLSAGADVRRLREQVLAGEPFDSFFATEYALDNTIATYPKPFVAHLAGVTMGGGLGLSAHAARRIAYPDTRVAMPETIIGFSPDAGVLYELSRAPGELGTHAALTGATFNATDAVLLGLADEVAGAAPAGVLAGQRAWIDACYSADDPVEILGRLAEHPDADARAAAAELTRRSPFAVAVALEAVRRARHAPDVAAVLAQDAALAPHLIGGPDFAEGVRALLVDKDGAPRWRHESLRDVPRADVISCF